MGKMLLALTLMVAVVTAAKAQQPSPHAGHGGHEGMVMDAQAITPDVQAKLLVDRLESEFNHHLAGLLVALGAVFMLFQDRLKARWTGVTLFWPACFLMSGLFLLVWSDTQLWPFGGRPWLDEM